MDNEELQVLDVDSVMDQVAQDIDTGITEGNKGGAEEHVESTASTDAGANALSTDDIPMPQSWKKEWEPDWKSTPKNARERFIEREKQMLTGIDGYKNDAAYGRNLRKAFEPYMDILKSQGVDEVNAISYLLNAHKSLSDPRQARSYIDRIAKSYGIDMAAQVAQAAADGQQPMVAPEMKAALERVERIEGYLTERQQAEYESRKESTSKEVEAFASDPAHPYFDECSEDIVKLINAGYNLQEAYDKAIWANPVTRQKEIGRMQKEQADEARRKATEAARQAKKVTSINVKGRDSARTPTEPAATVADMEDSMKETLAEIRSRT